MGNNFKGVEQYRSIIMILIPPRTTFWTADELQKTQTGGPSCPIKPKKCFGSYCMRAEVPLIKDNTGDIISNFYGYDNLPTITGDTIEACELRRREGETCGTAKLLFMHDVPNCNGLITQENKEDGHIKILRYRK